MNELYFTDDTTTRKIDGTEGYSLRWGRWAPAVTRINRGGLGPFYKDVEERLLLDVSSATSVSEALQRNHQLRDLLLQAERWFADSPVDAVKIGYKPQGSALTNAPEAAIVGDVEYIQPPDFDAVDKKGYNLNGVQVRFKRRGLWLGDTESKAASVSAGNPAIMTPSTFTDDFSYQVPHDLKIAFSGGSSGSIGAINLHMLVQSAANKLYLAEAESQSLTNMTSTAVGGSSAGSVASVDTGVTTAQLVDTSPGMNADVRAMEFFTMVKNNSFSGDGDHSYDLTISVRVGNEWYDGRAVTVSPDIGGGRIIKLGRVSFPGSVDQIKLNIAASKSVLTSNQLYVDYLCGIAVDDDANTLNAYLTTDSILFPDHDGEVYVEHRLNSHLEGVVYSTPSGGTPIESYFLTDGRIEIMVSGNTVSALVFGNDSGSYIIEDSLGAELNMTLTATKTKGYLLPR